MVLHSSSTTIRRHATFSCFKRAAHNVRCPERVTRLSYASFVGTLQALGLLGDAMSGTQSDWARLSQALDDALEAVRSAVGDATELFRGKSSIDLVGNGCAFGVAGYAALLMREFARVPAQSWATHNFLHGPMEPNDAQTAVVVIGDGREVKLAADMAAYGIPSVLITQSSEIRETHNLRILRLPSVGDGLIGAIAIASVAQLLVVELAEARGFQSCNFRYRQTDTKIAV